MKIKYFFIGAFLLPLSVTANTIEFLGSGTPGSDGPGSAEAVFTLFNGGLTLTLTDLEQNPTGCGQLISGINFDLGGLTGSGDLTTANSGNISTISKGGSYTSGVADSLTSWQATHAGAEVTLTTLTMGKPSRLIIGPDSLGNFDPALGGFIAMRILQLPGMAPAS